MIARLKDQRGLTLAEMLVVVAVLAFMMGAIFTLQRQGQAAYLVGAARVEVQQNARIAVEGMLNELRSALSITTATNCSTGATSITFQDQNGQSLTYARVGAGAPYRLDRTGPTGTETVIGGVRALDIRCFDASGTATATSGRIRTVRVRITTETERSAATNQPGDQRAVVEARVRLRNVI